MNRSVMWRDRRLGPLSDRIFLGGAFILGCAGAFFFKFLQLEPWLPAAFSAVVLLTYVALSWVSGTLEAEPETIGDNCYYLGFTFTLASLGGSFQTLSATSGEHSIRAVLSGFGIAIASTLLGIMLRVILLRMSDGATSVERQGKSAIERQVDDFERALMRSAEVLAQFQRRSSEMLDAQFAALSDAAELSAERQRKLAEELIERQAKAADEAADTFARALAERLRQLEADLSSAMVESIGKLSAQTGDEIIARTRDVTTAVARQIEEQGRTLSSSAELARRLGEGGRALQIQVGALTAAMAESAPALENGVTCFGAGLDAVSKRLDGAVRPLETASTQASAILASAGSRIDAAPLVSSIETARTTLEAEVLRISRTLGESLDEASRTLRAEALAEAVADVAGRFVEPGERMSEAGARLAGLAEAFEGAVEKLDQATTSSLRMAQALEQRLRDMEASEMEAADASAHRRWWRFW